MAAENELFEGERQPVKINILSIVFDLVKQWWIIAMVLAVSLLGSYIYVTETYVPTYTATAMLVVSSKGSTSNTVYSNLNAAESLAEVFSYIIDSDVVKTAAANSIGEERFNGTVSSSRVEGTNLIIVSVKGYHPKEAFQLLHGLLREHVVVSDLVMSNIILDVLQAPTVPVFADNSMSRRSRSIQYTLIITAISVAVLAAISFLNDTIKDESDIEAKLDVKHFATVYHEHIYSVGRNKKGRDPILVSKPTTSAKFVETYRIIRTRIINTFSEKNGKVLLVTSTLSGEGKSTVSVNIALSMAMHNKKVLLMDCDMIKPTVARTLGVRVLTGRNIRDLVTKQVSTENAMVYEPIPNLHLALGRKSVQNSTDIIASDNMRAFIEEAKMRFDYVIIDSPPTFAAPDAECLAALSDGVLLVVRQHTATARKINDAAESIGQTGCEILGCIYNDYKSYKLFGEDSIFGIKRPRHGYGYGYKYGYRYGYRYGYSYGRYGYSYGHPKNERQSEEADNSTAPAAEEVNGDERNDE